MRIRTSALAIVVAGWVLATAASAGDVQLDACRCIKAPGEHVTVTLSVSNPGTHAAGLLVALRTPDGYWRYYSPAGLIQTPTWIPLPPGLPQAQLPLLDLDLGPDSLPLSHFPLVGPFRYYFAAILYDSVTLQPLAPIALTYFDFAPTPPAPLPAGPGTLHLIVHQHNEVAWLEREEVYLPLGAEFIRDAIAETDRSSSYRFVVDQMPVLEEFRATYPALVPKLQSLFDSGVCEASGGYLVESDLNLLSGESIARQAIYGQEYLQQQWGRRALGAWHLDAFGHSLQMPQITRKAGMLYYSFARGVEKLGDLPGSEFYWAAPDGSRVLAHYMPHFYQLGREIGQVSDTSPELNEVFALLAPRASTTRLMAPVGADVGQHVFDRFLPEAIANWNALQQPGVSAQMSSSGDFFTQVEGSGVPLQMLSNVEFQSVPGGDRVFAGAYATRIEIKKTNNRLETELLDAEKLATFASFDGRAYPETSLHEQGVQLAINQTHDYLPGSGVDAIYEDADDEVDDLGDRFTAIEAVLDAEREGAIDHLRARIDTTGPGGSAGSAIVVFNTMAWQRRDLSRVRLANPQTTLPARLVDAAGAEVPYQVGTTESGETEIVFLASVPAMGWTTYWLIAGAPLEDPAEVASLVTTASTVPLGGFAVEIDANAFVAQISSTTSGVPLLPFGGVRGGDVEWSDERYGNAYEYDPLAENPGLLSAVPQSIVRLDGPVMTRFVAVAPIAIASIAVRELRLVPELERIEHSTTLYWADANKNVRVRFPFADMPGAILSEGVPYGFLERGDGDQPARWADLGTDQRGVTILNRGLFGHRFQTVESGRVLDITLLRSLDRAVFGDEPSVVMLEHGVHRAEYALLPRQGSWRQLATPHRAAEFETPLIARETTMHAGALARERSHLEVGPASNAVVTVFRREGDGVVVRLYETEGASTPQSMSLPSLTAASITLTNLLGDPLSNLAGGSRIDFTPLPQEILTFRLGGIQNGGSALVP